MNAEARKLRHVGHISRNKILQYYDSSMIMKQLFPKLGCQQCVLRGYFIVENVKDCKFYVILIEFPLFSKAS